MAQAQRSEVVLLGASNLARGLASVVGLVRARTDVAPRMLAALGRGRSLGLESSFCGRRLPSVLECGLWRELDRPTHALVCDVGNDLAYGVEPERVVEWLRETLRRLQGARIVLASLPIAKLRSIPRWQVRIWSKLIFPSHAIDPSSVVARAEELDRSIAQVARESGATLVALDPRWYFLDPIHFAPWRRREVWRAIVAPLGPASSTARSDWSFGVRAPLLVPERRRLWGVEQRGRQPCYRWPDGAQLNLF
jgi:hypothetical protein